MYANTGVFLLIYFLYRALIVFVVGALETFSRFETSLKVTFFPFPSNFLSFVGVIGV